jgi:hypothetical protein
LSVKDLIEELKKLPPSAELQDVTFRISGRYSEYPVTAVRWQGNHVSLEDT